MAIERQHRPIDKEFEEADYTGVLDISDRKLRLFPNIGDDIYDSLEVFVAIVSGNRFDKFPKQIFNYSNLVTLNFHHNSLRSVPPEISSLQELKELNLSRNYLKHLPHSISSMKLHLLCVNNNRLTELPTDIGQMKTLRNLDISRNELVDLPSSITELHNLTYLNMHRNEIRELPEDISKIPLTFLNVSANMLTRLPPSLRHINTLTHFYCENNPLEWPPAQVCMRGINHVFKYLSDIEKYGSDPQQFATNRDESLLRRRNNRSKKTSRPTSDASTLSGSGSDYGERSFIDEMTNFVQSAFGGNDTRIFQSDHSTGKYWAGQYSAYEERSPYRHIRTMKEETKGRYRSQSPGPPGKQQSTNSSQSVGIHYSTLPRANKDTEVDESKKGPQVSSNRMSSPVFPDRALRSHSSEPNSTSDQHLPQEKSFSKYASSSSTSEHTYKSHETNSNEGNSSPPSREGSVTPTPEDLDEPQTPKEDKQEYPRPKVVDLVQNVSLSVDDQPILAQYLKVSLDEAGSMESVYKLWLERNPSSTWADIIDILKSMKYSTLVSTLEDKFKPSSFTLDIESEQETSADINTTPQHEVVTKQVSFSVEVSEVPPRASISSDEYVSDDLNFNEECVSPTVPSSDDMTIEEDLPSPTKPKGPTPPPKPKGNKDNTTWPRQRQSGGPHKRKADVFKVIGKQDPNFTVRRQMANMQQEIEKIQNVKQEMESVLQTQIADDLGESISDGVLLCQLVNKLYPGTISTIHVPKGTEPLSAPKQTMNVAAFIAACKKLGVPEGVVCTAGEILEYKDPVRVTGCIRGLLDILPA